MRVEVDKLAAVVKAVARGTQQGLRWLGLVVVVVVVVVVMVLF